MTFCWFFSSPFNVKILLCRINIESIIEGIHTGFPRPRVLQGIDKFCSPRHRGIFLFSPGFPEDKLKDLSSFYAYKFKQQVIIVVVDFIFQLKGWMQNFKRRLHKMCARKRLRCDDDALLLTYISRRINKPKCSWTKV